MQLRSSLSRGEPPLPLVSELPRARCPQRANICGRGGCPPPPEPAAGTGCGGPWEGSARWMGSLGGGEGLGPALPPPDSDG